MKESDSEKEEENRDLFCPGFFALNEKEKKWENGRERREKAKGERERGKS